MNAKEFATKHEVRLTAEPTDSNPGNPEWRDADHWKCKLRSGRRSMTVYFSKGYGHNGEPPTAEEVLECLALDACGYDNAADFDDWASEYGYDTDSRKAERSWRAVGKQALRLLRFLGEDAYQELLYKVEG